MQGFCAIWEAARFGEVSISSSADTSKALEGEGSVVSGMGTPGSESGPGCRSLNADARLPPDAAAPFTLSSALNAAVSFLGSSRDKFRPATYFKIKNPNL